MTYREEMNEPVKVLLDGLRDRDVTAIDAAVFLLGFGVEELAGINDRLQQIAEMIERR